MKKRGSGILCHITSLPSPFGIGDFGPGAFAFADFLHRAGQSYWQLLPLNPTNKRYFDSPFSSLSSCAGNTALISPEAMVPEGLLTQSEVEDLPAFPEDRVDYQAVSTLKTRLFNRAHRRFLQSGATSQDYARFCKGNASWLEGHALFSALTDHLGGLPLGEWPSEYGDRNSSHIPTAREELAEAIEREKFLQYTFYRQWHALKDYCNGKGISIIGDFPLFMNYDAADIWAAPELFKVDQRLKPRVVAGSPPDAFSEQGQLFNCAVYDWEAMKADGYDWWLRRFNYLFKLYDMVRIDHFRGLVASWEVPAGERNALNGSWQEAPCHDFFRTVLQHYPTFPAIAEDLGLITAEVREAMHSYRIPGMKILLLAFQKGAMEESYLPHNHVANCVVYTGTHDTNTLAGWFDHAGEDEKGRLFRYLGREVHSGINWDLIRLAMMSVAQTAVIQMQDVLGCGEGSRMNTPGKAEGNWQWRIPAVGYDALAGKLRDITACYGRAG